MCLECVLHAPVVHHPRRAVDQHEVPHPEVSAVAAVWRVLFVADVGLDLLFAATLVAHGLDLEREKKTPETPWCEHESFRRQA
jgi:hypothetical protein